MNKKSKLIVFIAVLAIILTILNAFMFFHKRRQVILSEAGWQKLNLILRQIQSNYVDTINTKKLTDVALEAIMSDLDPHSVYLPPVALKKANSELAGKFYGIGIQFNVPNDTAIVLDIIPGGPAEKVGLMKGDRIIKVDGKTIAGVRCPQDSMVFRMKGEENTKVHIVVRREKEDIPFEIVRGKIPIHSVVAYYMINDTTGYIRLTKFSDNTFTEFSSAADILKKGGMKHLIVDLRDNTGGYFAQALLMSDLFLSKGAPIVYLQGLHRKKEAYNADGKGDLQNIGLSVLINENSASSSEIFAGAMQDNDRGVIVGRRSFGKGLVQEAVNLTDGSGIRLTVARFYTPSGRCIQKPYGNDYSLEVYKRYADGEMFNKDSIKVNKEEVYKTLGGRTVYGGGGIIPDIYVPIDTTKVTSFYINCNKKSVLIRFTAYIFDIYKNRLINIDSYSDLEKFYRDIQLDKIFLDYVSKNAGLKPKEGEWNKSKSYMMIQIKALLARYSKLGENAFYRISEPLDNVLQMAIKRSHSSVKI